MPDDGNPFKRFFALGYTALVPLIPVGASLSPRSSLALRVGRPGAKDPRGKAPGVLTEAGWTGKPDWTRGEATQGDLERWHSHGADVGIRMGDGLFGLDVDTLDAELAATCWWTICKIIPGAHAKRIGRAPKFAIILRVALDVRLPYKLIEFGRGPDGKPERVEGLSNGKQLKVWRLHPTTGLPYSHEPAMPARADLVEASQAQIDELFEALRAVLPASSEVRTEGVGADRSIASLRGDPDMVEAAARRLPNTTKHFPTREHYRDVGYAIKAGIADERRAFAAFAEWSDRWDDDPEGEGNVYGYAEAIWRTLHPRKIGASWLLEKLEAVTGTAVAEHWFAPIEAATASLWDAAPQAGEGAATRAPFELTDFVDAAGAALAGDTRPLIKGLLDQGTLGMMFGPSGAGKTFTALDIAFHVALGLAWNGMRVRRARVVYIAAEGASGARKRSAAILRRHGMTEGELRGWFLYRMANVDLFHPEADLAPAIEAIAAVEDLGLVVVDTLSAVFAGGDENSPVDMGTLVKNLNRLRAATGAHVMAVHHTGKDEARGARGHSLLKAALDTELEVLDHRLTATKQREIETNWSCAFSLDIVQLGRDADGDPVTSCVVRWEEPGSATAAACASERRKQQPPSDSEREVLAALNVAYEMPEHVGRGVRVHALVEVLEQRTGRTMRFETLRTQLSRLGAKGWAEVQKGLWRPIAEAPQKTIEADVFA